MTDLNDFRREIALQCLLVFLESPGDRADKVGAAVAYADELIEQLAAPVRPATSAVSSAPDDDVVRWIGAALDVLSGKPPACGQKVSMAELRDRLVASGTELHRALVEQNR